MTDTHDCPACGVTHEVRCHCEYPTFDYERPYDENGFFCGNLGCCLWRDEDTVTGVISLKERPMNATRGEVYAAIDSERAYQDMRKQRDQGAEYHSLEEFLLYMDDYLADAKHIASRTWGPEATPKTLEVLRKVVALGVAAMEQHGAPQREGFSRFVRYDADYEAREQQRRKGVLAQPDLSYKRIGGGLAGDGPED